MFGLFVEQLFAAANVSRLRLLRGLMTDEITRAYLLPEQTVAQRIVRAKRTLAEARVPFEVPLEAGRRRVAAVCCPLALPPLPPTRRPVDL